MMFQPRTGWKNGTDKTDAITGDPLAVVYV